MTPAAHSRTRETAPSGLLYKQLISLDSANPSYLFVTP